MPCHVDPPTASEKSQAREAALEHANFYMHQADMLRELLLAENPNKTEVENFVLESSTAQQDLPYISAYGKSRADEDMINEHYEQWARAMSVADAFLTRGRFGRKAIEKDQIAHRKVDIQRLIKTFADQGKFDKIAPLLTVDFTKPLEPQIGYDPDKY